MTIADKGSREPPFSDAELAELWPGDEPWPFNDDDGVEDEEELDMLRSFERGEWRPAANHEAALESARAIARATMRTWDTERRAEVARRWGNQRINGEGAAEWRRPLAGDGVSGDNPAEG